MVTLTANVSSTCSSAKAGSLEGVGVILAIAAAFAFAFLWRWIFGKADGAGGRKEFDDLQPRDRKGRFTFKDDQ